MKTKYFFLAAIGAITLASCSNDEFIGDNSPTLGQEGDGSIQFSYTVPNATRADIVGDAAADLLGNNFYVSGTKGTEQSTYPTPTEVFDNYLVHYGVNTAGTTESNTANWEYVGIDQAASPKTPADYERVKLSGISHAQTIKYWDYSAAQYDFLAFSTGDKKAVNKTNLSGSGVNPIEDGEIGVTAMKYGKGLDVESSVPTAYTFYIPTLEGLQNAFITDIKEVAPADYGKEVTLKFKNLGSKIRVALYETVPGYSVKDVKFYQADAGASPGDLGIGTVATANLIGADNLTFPTTGTISVRFPHVGNSNSTEQDYNVADAQVEPYDKTYNKYKDFGALTAQLVAKERDEVKDNGDGTYSPETSNVFLGRTLPNATFAGSAAAKFYTPVFPNTTGYALTLRVDYTLVPIDGAKETIVVKGAKAVVPSTYTTWKPNYAYTYVFKISDNTNGWTGTVSQEKGLFPITFDAVVTEATDVTGEQTTITTVATPSITTYQQNHTYATDEYSKSTKGKDNVVRSVYVQVMDNSDSPASLVTTLNGNTPEGKAKSLLYVVSEDDATEAEVMDALQKRTAAYDGDAATIKGRNGITLTKSSYIDNTVATIVNGVNDEPITIAAGKAAKLDIANLEAGTTYAYVYDYTTSSRVAGEKTIYQPISVTASSPIDGSNATKTYPYISFDDLITAAETPANITTAGDVDKDYIYFSVTTNGTGVKTVSYYSVDGKDKVPAGLLKVLKTSLSTDKKGADNAAADTFYFDTYFSNDGKYAVKVIKVVA